MSRGLFTYDVTSNCTVISSGNTRKLNIYSSGSSTGSGFSFVEGNVGIGTNNPTTPLHVIGNATIIGDINATTITGTLSTAAQPTITSVGTLTSLNVSGGIAGTLSTAAQPTITSVGTLTSLNVSGSISAPYIERNPAVYNYQLSTAQTITPSTINGLIYSSTPYSNGSINTGNSPLTYNETNGYFTNSSTTKTITCLVIYVTAFTTPGTNTSDGFFYGWVNSPASTGGSDPRYGHCKMYLPLASVISSITASTVIILEPSETFNIIMYVTGTGSAVSLMAGSPTTSTTDGSYVIVTVL